MVDDHEAVRNGLRSLLAARADLLVCGEAANGAEAVEGARTLRPDVVLMDVSMPGMNGIEATKAIRSELPGCKVVIVSENERTLTEKLATEIGAHGFVAKANLARELLPTLESLIEHGSDKAASGADGVRPASPQWMMGGGEMGEFMRSTDWRKTPLGPPERWPQSLRTAVSICLNSKFALLVWWGPDLVMLYNDAYRQIIGAKHPAAFGHPGRDCWHEIWDTIGPMLHGVMSQGKATWSDDLLLMLERHGYPEECYFTFSYSPIRDESGGIGGVFTPVKDQTEMVIGQRRLRTLRDLAALSAEVNSEEKMWPLAARIVGENPYDIPFAVFYRLTPDRQQIEPTGSAGLDAESKLLSGAMQMDAAGSSFEKALANVIQTGKAQEIAEIGRYCASLPLSPWGARAQAALALPISLPGQDLPSGVLLAAVSPHKQLDESYGTFYDLLVRQIGASLAEARSYEAERQRAEALAELDRAKTAFFSNVSHEFRTPLTLMIGPVSDMLGRGSNLRGDDYTQLLLVHRNGLRLLKLVNTLLDFSRIEAGHVQGLYEPTDLAALTSDLVSVFRSAVERAGLRLIVECPPLGEPIYVDRDMWEKVVLNLVSNALKFTLQGEIAVKLRLKDGAAELSVRDTGSGIPAKELPRVFERFHRVQGAKARSTEGTGIGLALVQELVRLHGGSIHVESTEGEGTTFVVNIPRGRAHLPEDRVQTSRTLASTALGATPYVEEALRWLPDARSAEASEIVPREELSSEMHQAARADERSGASRSRILVADDNADMRDYLRRLLSERYDVETVGDGGTAFASASKHAPDLILSDVMMPEMNGFELVERLRADAKLSAIPIVLLSARAGEEARVGGMESGADDYLIKPFSARELLARVQTHLELARVRKQNQEALQQITNEAIAAEAKFRAVFEQTTVFAGIMTLDGVILDANRLCLDACGYRDEEVLGRRFWETGWWRGSKEVQDKIRAATMQAAEGVASRQVLPYLWADGAERWVEFALHPIRDHEGRIIFLHPTGVDITDLKQAEDKYRALAETLETQVRNRTEELELRNREVLRQSEQLRQLSHRLMQIQDDERRHIARELHDSAGQILAALGMNLAIILQRAKQSAPQLAKAAEEGQELLQELTQEIRTTSYLLHPPMLDESGLAEALRWYIKGLQERSGLNVTLSVPEGFGRLPDETELVIFRIVQECLTNVHRHSESKSAAIRIIRDNHSVSVQVQDQGKGIPPAKLIQLQTQAAGVGIRGMRERVLQLGGAMSIRSDGGTTISITLPVPAETDKKIEGPRDDPAAVNRAFSA